MNIKNLIINLSCVLLVIGGVCLMVGVFGCILEHGDGFCETLLLVAFLIFVELLGNAFLLTAIEMNKNE